MMGLDIKNAQKAMERASAAARAHMPSANSGAISREEDYVRRLNSRAQDAVLAWANWEAINNALAKDAAKAVEWLELGAIGSIRKSLARDAIIAAFTLSDVPQKNRVTLCSVADWLNSASLRDELTSEPWLAAKGCAEFMIDSERQANKERIERILAADWRNDAPGDSRLKELRARLRPTRNQLAHTLETDLLDRSAPSVDEMREFIRLTLNLTTDAALIWLGAAIDPETVATAAQKRAIKFWNYAFQAPIESWRADQHRLAELKN